MENNENKENDEKIIQKCIDISCVEKDNTKNSIFSFGWKNNFANWKDNLKYNYIRFTTKFEMLPETIHLFNKIYDTHKNEDKKKFNQKISKIIMVSYRSKYKPQLNIKNNTKLTSDCGWGCMIRSSQMILCRALYKIFKYKYNIKENDKLIKMIIPFIMENNLKLTKEHEYAEMDNYINKLKSFGKKDIIEIDPPFSIHKICILGEKFGRTCGEWFSDFELPKIYDIINTTFDIFPYLSIIHFNSIIELKTILERCFKEDTTNNDNNNNNNNNTVENNINDNNTNEIITNKDNNIPIENNPNVINSKDNNINTINDENKIKIEDKTYVFEKMGLIFITVRLGVSKVAADYFPSLKKKFDCKECIGFIGGKKYSNSASYFFGYYNNHLLYLDPHYNNISINKLDEESIKTYTHKTIYQFKFGSLKGGLTLGFLFRNIKEFNDLLTCFRENKKEEFPCFDYSEKMSNKKDDEYLNKVMKEMSNDDDF